MLRKLFGSMGIALVGCVPLPPAPQAPAPVQLTTTRPIAEVMQRAATELVNQGFTIEATSDAAGIVTGSRTGRVDRIWDLLRCGYPKNSMAARWSDATLRVSVTTKSSTEGLSVQITPRVTLAEASGAPSIMRGAVREGDCVSSGVIEAAVAKAIASSTPGRSAITRSSTSPRESTA